MSKRGIDRLSERHPWEGRQSVQGLPLPQPAVLQSRVDRSRTKTWEVKRTTWGPCCGDQDQLRDEVMFRAQELVAHAAVSAESIQKAKTAAAAIITSFYGEVDWQVEVTRAADATGRP